MKLLRHAVLGLAAATSLHAAATAAESINTRLEGRPVAEVKKSRLNHVNEALGFFVMTPRAWMGQYAVATKGDTASFNCQGKPLFSIRRVDAKTYHDMIKKPDYMGELLASRDYWMWVNFTAPQAESAAAAAQTACQKMADEVSLVTQSFMLIEDGKLLDPTKGLPHVD